MINWSGLGLWQYAVGENVRATVDDAFHAAFPGNAVGYFFDGYFIFAIIAKGKMQRT